MARMRTEGCAVDLNQASVEDLATLRLVGRERAERIIGYREEHGPFKNWDDLKRVPGVSEGTIQDMKNSGACL